MKKEWVPLEFDYKDLKKNQNKLSEIIEGTKPALIIRNFYDVGLCQIVAKNTKDLLSFTDEKQIHKKIGISLLSFLTHKSDYFHQAKSSRKTLRKIFEKIEDPRKKIHRLLSEFYPNKNVKVATEGEKKYACGVIRVHELGDHAQVHRDYVRFEAPNFNVSRLYNQLSTVLYLQQTERGGDLVIYKKSWKKSDERFRQISFGYSRRVLEGCNESVQIKPRPGDLIIINPIYFHEILPVKGQKKRITLGLFLAFSDYSNHILTWS